MNSCRVYNAFTLIEVTITVAILAVVSAVVVVNYRVPISNARAENMFEQIDQLDHRIRLWTNQNNAAAKLRIDPDHGTFSVEHEETVTIRPIQLGNGMKLGTLRIDGQSVFGSDFTIPYTSRGVAPLWSYSIILPDGREKFRLMLGAVGQSMTMETDADFALENVE